MKKIINDEPIQYDKKITEADLQGFLDELCKSKVSKTNTFTAWFYGTPKACKKILKRFDKALKNHIANSSDR